MNLPACPHDRKDCRFQHEYGVSTCMWSPIEYDRDGKPVDGGMNTSTQNIRCNTCGQSWTSSQTELEDAQGKRRVWTLKPQIPSAKSQ